MGDHYRTPGIIGHSAPFGDVHPAPDPLEAKGGGSGKAPGGAAVVLNLFGDYPNDWTDAQAEVDHMRKKPAEWMPGIDDFADAMGIKNLTVVSTFSEFLGAIQQQPKDSIIRINFVSHGDLGNIAMAGKVVSDKTATSSRPAGTVTFANSLKSGDLVGGTQLEQGAISVRDHFREGAEIFLYLCNAGINLGLMGEISKALKVKVRGFKDEIRYCPEFKLDGKGKLQSLNRARVTLQKDCDSGKIEDRLTKLTPQSSFP